MCSRSAVYQGLWKVLEPEAQVKIWQKACLLEAYICVADGSQTSKQRPVAPCRGVGCAREKLKGGRGVPGGWAVLDKTVSRGPALRAGDASLGPRKVAEGTGRFSGEAGSGAGEVVGLELLQGLPEQQGDRGGWSRGERANGGAAKVLEDRGRRERSPGAKGTRSLGGRGRSGSGFDRGLCRIVLPCCFSGARLRAQAAQW